MAGDREANYLSGRVAYRRPQAMLWSDNAGSLKTKADGTSIYVPTGYEYGTGSRITNIYPGTPVSGQIRYIANNSFSIGDSITITGVSISAMNGTFTIIDASSTYFTITNSTTGSPTYTNAVVTPTTKSFILLSDDGRQPIDFKPMRIEQRQRMINARMRSYHIADKLTISTSWNLLPSRSFYNAPGMFDVSTGATTNNVANPDYTSDGGAGGVELLNWYENHTGPFYVFLSYDNYRNFGTEVDPTSYMHLAQYSQIIQMYITDFNYSVVKRGGRNMDMWNISVTLEEV